MNFRDGLSGRTSVKRSVKAVYMGIRLNLFHHALKHARNYSHNQVEQVEHTHISLVTLTQSMSQFPVHPSITPSLCLYTGVLIIEPQRSLITLRERKGEREK